MEGGSYKFTGTSEATYRWPVEGGVYRFPVTSEAVHSDFSGGGVVLQGLPLQQRQCTVRFPWGGEGVDTYRFPVTWEAVYRSISRRGGGSYKVYLYIKGSVPSFFRGG